MPGSNKAVGAGELQGVTAHLPLFSIPPGSPPRPSDSFSGQLQSTRKPAPPATPIIGFEKQQSVQLVSAGRLCRHACRSLSALKSLIRRLEIVINSQQVPLAPLTKSGTCTWSALAPKPSCAPPAATDMVGRMVSLEGQRQFLLYTSQRKGTASETLRSVFALPRKLLAAFKGLQPWRSSQLQPSHVEGLDIGCNKEGLFINAQDLPVVRDWLAAPNSMFCTSCKPWGYLQMQTPKHVIRARIRTALMKPLPSTVFYHCR